MINIDAILEFLFSNLLLVFVLIGGIISFVQRLLGEEQKKTQKNPTMRKPVLTNEEPVFQKTQRSATIDKEERDIQGERAQAEKDEPDVPLQQEVEKEEIQQYREEKQLPPFKKVNKQEVVNGIIWSEILGPPRAKKPHLITMQYRIKKRG